MARDDFEGAAGSGGGFNEYEFTVTDARFETVPNYMDGNVYFLHWYGISDVDGHEQMLPGEYHPSFALGSDWTSVDGGKTVQYTGASRRPKMGRRYGMLMNQVLKITEDIAGTPEDPLDSIDPKVAADWIGTKWFIERYEHDFGGQIGPKEVELPTKYLGKQEVTSPLGGATQPAPAPQPAPAAAPQANGAAGDDVRGSLVALAQASNSFEEFRAQALAIPSVTANPSLVTEVLDQANGIFAQANA